MRSAPDRDVVPNVAPLPEKPAATETDAYKRRWLREKTARESVEKIIEQKSAQLYEANGQLEQLLSDAPACTPS